MAAEVGEKITEIGRKVVVIGKFVIYSLLIIVSGCATMEHMDELLTLKSISDSQRDIDIYLKKQEKGFKKLEDDINNGRLCKGASKKYIIDTYYEPVLARKVDNDDGVKEILLYRNPTEYFQSDRIYLSFNNRGRLVSWELKPADCQS